MKKMFTKRLLDVCDGNTFEVDGFIVDCIADVIVTTEDFQTYEFERVSLHSTQVWGDTGTMVHIAETEDNEDFFNQVYVLIENTAADKVINIPEEEWNCITVR